MEFIRGLYPLNRTLVSEDTDLTLKKIGEALPRGRMQNAYRIVEVPSGTSCWTWTAPKKYVLRQAYLEDSAGNRIVDVRDSYLHVASYSQPVDAWLSYDALLPHLHYNIRRPGAIPWKFYYYDEDWAFCMPYNTFRSLDRTDTFHAVIDAEFVDGALKIGELYFKGHNTHELLIITNICHPCQVNDSITGVSVVIDMLHQLSVSDLNISVRVLFLPETIGSIGYFATQNGVSQNIRWGIFTEMLGNPESIALQYSYQGNTYIDRVSEYVLRSKDRPYRTGGFREIVGNDELVTNGPGLHIPTISLSRSKGAGDCFPEYHTSDDKPDILIEDHLVEARGVIQDIIGIMNSDYIPRRRFKGPIFLSGNGLWGIWGDLPEGKEQTDRIMYLLEGDQSVFDIAYTLGLRFEDVKRIVDAFAAKGLIECFPL